MRKMNKSRCNWLFCRECFDYSILFVLLKFFHGTAMIFYLTHRSSPVLHCNSSYFLLLQCLPMIHMTEYLIYITVGQSQIQTMLLLQKTAKLIGKLPMQSFLLQKDYCPVIIKTLHTQLVEFIMLKLLDIAFKLPFSIETKNTYHLVNEDICQGEKLRGNKCNPSGY